MKKNQEKYNFENAEFKDNADFFKRTLGIEVIEYFSSGDMGIEFQKAALYKQMLRKTLELYRKNGDGMIPTDFDIESFVQENAEDEVQKIPNLIFNRIELNKIRISRGEDIAKWMQEDLKNVTHETIVAGTNPSVDKLTAIILKNQMLAMNAGFGEILTCYGCLSPMAPVALEGASEYMVIFRQIAAAIASNPIAPAVIISICCAIAIILLSISAIDRMLTGLIINDTNYDMTVDDIYMCHGSLTAVMNDTSLKHITKISKKKAENMVYGSFYTIEKNFGLIGTECTMRLKFDNPNKSIYYLSSNPLSQSSRINFALNNNSSSEKMHDYLYEHGRTDIDTSYGNLCLSAHLNSESGAKAYAVTYISEEMNDSIWFRDENPTCSDNMWITEKKNYRFDKMYSIHEILKDGYINMKLKSNEKNKKIMLVLAKDIYCDSVMTEILYNGNPIANFEIHSAEYDKYTFPIPNYLNCEDSDATISVRNAGMYGVLNIGLVQVQNFLEPPVLSDWMKELNDTTLLEDINIPGTHDTAAINSKTHTLYACHHTTVTEQLQNGIRLMDVRIKVKEKNGDFVFMTCHGSIGGSTTVNEYQSFDSLMKECKDFLKAHSSEIVIMSLKIDDWEIPISKHNMALVELKKIIEKYPIKNNYRSLGTLQQARGKIVLLNRINEDLFFGAPMFWAQNTENEYAKDTIDGSTDRKNRDFEILVQDKFQFGVSMRAERDKYLLTVKTFKDKSKGDKKVVLNYASACKYGTLGVYIQKDLITYFGKDKSQRPKCFGWVLFDYETDTYRTDVYGQMNIVSIIVDSNFGYSGCDRQFSCLGFY